jgi:hypothetical protein
MTPMRAPVNLWQAAHWRLRSVQLAIGVSTAQGRVGARFFGLVLNRYPLCALFINTSWLDPAMSAGLALGPLELTLSMLIRALPPQVPEAPRIADTAGGTHGCL